MTEAAVAVTVTDPSHPLYGRRFAVVPAAKGARGDYIHVTHCGGTVLPHTTLVERGYKGQIYQTHGAATPDFVRLAEAFGIRATAVDGLSDDFGQALAAHLADPEPTLLLARASLTPPPTTSPRWHRQGPPSWADPLAGL